MQLEAEYGKDWGGTDREKKQTTWVSPAQKRGTGEGEGREGFQMPDIISIATWILR